MTCPCCGARGLIERDPQGDTPEPRDLVCCVTCGALCVITLHQALREFTADDVDSYTLEELARLRLEAAGRRADS